MSRGRPQRRKQRAVREERFERSLDAMNFEMAQKVAHSLYLFHEEYVSPLEKRVTLLETLLGIRLFWWLYGLGERVVLWFYYTFTEPVPEDEDENQEGEDEPPAKPMIEVVDG